MTNTANVVVGGLDNQFKSTVSESESNKGVTSDDLAHVTSGGSIEIKLIAQAKTRDAENNLAVSTIMDNILATARSKRKIVAMFIDLSVFKTVKAFDDAVGITTNLIELPSLIEIFIPLDDSLQGKDGYLVYRYHGTEVDIITTVENGDGEKIELIDNKTLKLTVKKFSTYAIAYNKTSSGSGSDDDNGGGSSGGGSSSGGGGSSDGKDDKKSNITTEATKGGKISEDKGSITITPDPGYQIKDVLVDGKSLGPVKEYTFKDSISKHTIKVIFVEIPKAEGDKDNKNTIKDNPFKDIQENDWFYHTALKAYEKGLIMGTSEDEFSPHLGTTRGMITTMIHRLEGEPISNSLLKFNDVIQDKWYAQAITWGNEKGIVVGYQDSIFKPDQNITRQELCAVLYRYAKYKEYDVSKSDDLSDFVDHKEVSSWALENVKWAVASEIIHGKGNGILDPKGIATRAEVATMLLNLMEGYEE